MTEDFEEFTKFFKENINFYEKSCKIIKIFSFLLGQVRGFIHSNRKSKIQKNHRGSKSFYDFQKSLAKSVK